MNTIGWNLAVAAALLAFVSAASACPAQDAPLAARVPAAALPDASRTPRSGHWEWQGNGHAWVEDGPVSRARGGSPR